MNSVNQTQNYLQVKYLIISFSQALLLQVLNYAKL